MGELANVGDKVRSRWRRLGKWAQWTIVTIVAVLVAARIAMPFVVKDYVNKRINSIPDYSGSVAKIRMHLWRGAYEIVGLDIQKSNGKEPEPFFSAPSIDLAIDSRELLHGKCVGSVELTRPRLNFIKGPTAETTQSGFAKPWGKTLESLFPFDINQLVISQGHIHFQDFVKKEPVDIYMTNLFAIATNLTNARDQTNALPAGLTADAQTIGGGAFHINLRMNPLDTAPTFELNAALTNVNLPALNQFLRDYGKFDVERGRLQLFTSVASLNGNYTGHVKVLFQNLKVFAWEKEKHKDILEIFWQAIVGTVATIFKNQPHDQLATDIPISGSFAAAKADMWGAVTSLLQNAFVRVMLPKLEPRAHLANAENKQRVSVTRNAASATVSPGNVVRAPNSISKEPAGAPTGTPK